MAKKRTRVVLPGGIQGLVHDLQDGTSNYAKRTIDDNANGANEERNAAEAKSAGHEETMASEPTLNVSGKKESGVATVEEGGGAAQRPEADVAAAGASGARPGHAPGDVSKPETAEERPRRDSMPDDSANARHDSVVATDGEPQSRAWQEQAQVASHRPEYPTDTERMSPTSLHDHQQASGPAAPSGYIPANSASATGVATSPADGRGRPPKENTMKEYHIVKDDSKDSWELFLDMAQQYKTGGGRLATIYIDESLKSVLDRLKYAGAEKFPTSAILSSIVARFIYDHEEEIRKELYSGSLI